MNLKKLLFGAHDAPPALAVDVRDALAGWRQQKPPRLDEPHYHSRYVVVDLAAAGLDREADLPLGIGAVGVSRGGMVVPGDAFAIDLAGDTAPEEFDRQLMALLRFCDKAPLVGYRVPFAHGFLQRVYRERLGLDFQPQWIDCAWLLADLFKERIDAVVPRDDWLESFGIQPSGRRDALAGALGLARLLQIALPRAVARGADTPAKLIDIAQARRFLRQSG